MDVGIRTLDRKITGFGRDRTVLILIVCSNSYVTDGNCVNLNG